MLNKELYDKYKPYRDELNRLFYKSEEKDYKKCIRKTKEFYRLLKKDGIIDKYNYYFVFTTLSKSYLHENNIREAKINADLSLKYAINDDYKIYAYWVLRNVYKFINKEKAKKFNECMEEYYKNKGETYSYADSLGEKGILLNDEKYILEAIKLFNRISDFEKYMCTKEDKLDEQYESLFNIYINSHYKNKRILALDILHNKITNQSLKIKLSKQIFELVV